MDSIKFMDNMDGDEMREIKFRGYCDRDSEWRYGCYITDGKIHEINTLLQDGKTLYGSQIDIESLGQFTGLLDKNGVEIYEGDIVKEPDHKSPSGEMISEVVFDKLAYFAKKGEMRGSLLHTSLYGEVIGNIYENKELLND